MHVEFGPVEIAPFILALALVTLLHPRVKSISLGGPLFKAEVKLRDRRESGRVPWPADHPEDDRPRSLGHRPRSLGGMPTRPANRS